MDKIEALELLELSESAGNSEIANAYREKYNHFQFLLTNAPNDILRKIHSENVALLEQAKNILGIAVSGPAQQSLVAGNAGSLSSSPHIQPPKPSGQTEPVAWLIRHMENKAHTYYPIWPGENPVGRSPVVNRRSIWIEDDVYMSRFHAVVIVTPGTHSFSIDIADDGRLNSGTPSKNGTYINGSSKRLKPNEICSIRDGDSVQIGSTVLILKLNNLQKTISGLVMEVKKTQFVQTVVIDL